MGVDLKVKESIQSIRIKQSVGLLLSIGFIFIGIFRGEHQTVLMKAVNICLECIGVG